MALLLCLSFLFIREVTTMPGFIPMATGPMTPTDTVESYGLGYWLWIGSAALALFASLGRLATLPKQLGGAK